MQEILREFSLTKTHLLMFSMSKTGSLIAIGLLFLSTTAWAKFEGTGKVSDTGGEPLIGVSILIQGTTMGTVTDFDGNFALNVPGESGVLIFSYTGFRTEEVAVSPAASVLQISMVEDIARLEEVVVTGLASTVKRSNSGNAVTSVTGEELTGNTAPQTLDNALYGKIPGVNMSANGGAPGGGINFQLRGVSTLGAGQSQPLFIIDGVYVDNSTIRTGRTQVNGASGGQAASNQDDAANRIADLNPDDIEKIEVLKGPSAAAIYGTRANAGVIIITTKRGKEGRTRISLSQDIGFAQGQNFVGFDPWDEAKIDVFRGGDEKEKEAYRQAVAEGRITDWEEYLYGETPLLSNTQLSISGGSQKTQFFVSGGMQREDGIIKNTDFDRYSLRANVDHQISDRIKVGINTNYLKTDNDRGFTGNQNNTGGSIGYNIAYTPDYADLFPDENGNYPNNPYFNDNPIAVRDLGTNNQKVDRFITAGVLDWDIFRRTSSFLKFKLNGGVDFLNGRSLGYFPEIMQHQQATANPGDVMWGQQSNINTNVQAFLIFNADLGAVNTNTSVGVVRLDQDSEFLLSRGRGLSGGQTNLQWAQVQSIQQQFNQRVTDFGVVIQEDLNWQDRIAASVGVRFDKSTLNVDSDKFYAFPKFSLAVNLHNFDFWNVGFMDQLKLRGAYGETGGLPNFGVIFESLTPQLIGGSLGGQVGTRGVDPNLEPETAQELEFGIDAGFFNSRLTLEATYYIKNVKDLILDLTPAESTGILAIATNAADLENKGVELGLGINPVRTANFNWFAKVLYWHNRSKLTRLNIPVQTVGGFGPSLGTYLFAEGYSPTTIVGTPAGTENPGGWTIYGDRQPDFQMSFLSQINFLKNFDFNFLLHWQSGGEAINLSALLWDDGGNAPECGIDKDNNETPDCTDRLLDWAVNGNTGVYIQPTSYLKLRELGLYYSIPRSLLGNTFIEGIRVGVSANNLLLWTDYGSYDPEVSNFGSQPVSGNIEVTPYPSSRRFFFHLKFDF